MLSWYNLNSFVCSEKMHIHYFSWTKVTKMACTGIITKLPVHPNWASAFLFEPVHALSDLAVRKTLGDKLHQWYDKSTLGCYFNCVFLKLSTPKQPYMSYTLLFNVFGQPSHQTSSSVIFLTSFFLFPAQGFSNNFTTYAITLTFNYINQSDNRNHTFIIVKCFFWPRPKI